MGRRLAIQLGSITALVVGAVLGIGILLLEQQRSDAMSLQIERARRVAMDAAQRQFDALESDANALVRRLEGDPAMLAQLLGRRAVDTGLTQTLAAVSGLDVIDLVGPDGTVVASHHWPERAGIVAPPARAAAPVAVIETPDGPRIGMQTHKEIRVGAQRVRLVAGQFREIEWLREVAALADAAWWFPPDGSPALIYAPARAPETLPQIKPVAVDGETREGSWRLVSLAAGGTTDPDPGPVVLGFVDRSPDAAWIGLRAGWVGLTLAAALAAALLGFAIGRRAGRPLEQLIRAVDAIAAGEEDYSFPAAAQDEFEALTASFSRLQRALEQQQRRSAAAERIAAWREVARHVAHEVKNPLAPIRLTVQNLQRAYTSAPERFDTLFAEGTQTILEEVDQLTRLVGEFSDFARLPLPDRHPERIDEILDEVLELHASSPGLDLIRRTEDDVPELALDRDQISRVFKNILGNAIEAQQDLENARVEVVVRSRDGDLEIEFTDFGPGFAPEAVRRVFEPYFTTKEQGTGLGMAISYRVVAEHGGDILAANHERGGARVTVRLPLGQTADVLLRSQARRAEER